MAVTKNIAEVIRQKLASDYDLAAAVEAERFKLNIGAEIYQARTQAGLTQKQLADLVNMHQSAVARIEDADYDGHSLKTLERIATALGKVIEINFIDPWIEKQMVSSEVFNINYSRHEYPFKEWTKNIIVENPEPQSFIRKSLLTV
jgi:transcriptional regulator with XRE-family HTH domain